MANSDSVFQPTGNPLRLYLVTVITIVSGYKYMTRSLSFLTVELGHFANNTADGNLDVITQNWLISIAGTAFYVGQFLGYFALPWALKYQGSRGTGFLTLNLVNIVGCALEILAVPFNTFWFFVIGHGLVGMSSSFSSANVMYLAECMPSKYRGQASMMTAVGYNAIMVLGALLTFSWCFGTDKLWYLYSVVGIALSALQICGASVFPNSPKFLYITANKPDEARKSVIWFNGSENEQAIDRILNSYQREKNFSPEEDSSKNLGIFTILKKRHFRIPFTIILVGRMAFRLSGNTISTQFMLTLVMSFGFNEHSAHVVMLSQLLIQTGIALLVALYLIDAFGRRNVLLFSIVVDLVGLLLIFASKTLVYHGDTTSDDLILASEILGAVGTFLMTSSLVLGLEKIPDLLVSELCPQQITSTTMTFSLWIGTIANILQALFFPVLELTVGPYAWFIFIISQIVCFWYLYCRMPDTRGKSVDEVVQTWIDEKKPQLGDLAPSTIVDAPEKIAGC